MCRGLQFLSGCNGFHVSSLWAPETPSPCGHRSWDLLLGWHAGADGFFGPTLIEEESQSPSFLGLTLAPTPHAVVEFVSMNLKDSPMNPSH